VALVAATASPPGAGAAPPADPGAASPYGATTFAAQQTLPPPTENVPRPPEPIPPGPAVLPGVVPGLALPGELGCADGECGAGCNGCCYPGHKLCDCCCNSNNCFGRFFGGVYECICCPDPCYEPHWVPLADSAFFVDGARPVTQMRFRGDFGWDLQFPDRGEYFWARADGNGKGPNAPNTNRLDYQEGTIYTEAAIDRFGMFVEIPYLHVSPDSAGTASGLGDINIGTKTLLLDCELLQFTFQFRTYIPSGNFTRGLGTGHASLEPAFLAAIKLSPTTYLQAETAYWFAVGGDSEFEANVFHYALSLNQLLWHCGNDIQLVATFEATGYEFSSGEFTSGLVTTVNNKVTAIVGHATTFGNIFNVGPGLRLHVCEKIDFGVGTQFAITDDHLAQELVRAEFRVRF
jgi:hypothetical protein